MSRLSDSSELEKACGCQLGLGVYQALSGHDLKQGKLSLI